jgi:hypothetical protein
MTERAAWLDVSAGVAGDMLLGALLDAGASLAAVRAAVEAVLAGAVSIEHQPVQRAGLRASLATVVLHEAPHTRRSWSQVRQLLAEARLAERVRRDATAVFGRLAAAEARVHGIEVADVHFHEVGAQDCIADIVGTCAALADLGVGELSAGQVAVGSGEVRTAHGTLPVPVPAVLELLTGWPISGTGSGELATPTGAALVATLAASRPRMPAMTVQAIGIGAGSRDQAGRANVVRVVLGSPTGSDGGDSFDAVTAELIVEANVDDLDPRVWPLVLQALLQAGASDAWLTPIVMKKGRPAHTVHALAAAPLVPAIREVLLAHTTTFGTRQLAVGKYALPRSWRPVEVDGGTARVKIAHRDGRILRCTPEFDDAAEIAERTGRPVQDVLDAIGRAASAAGLTAGAPVPDAG